MAGLKKLSGLLLLLMLTGTLSACELKLPPMPWDKKPHAQATQTEPNVAEEEGGTAESEAPVDESMLLPKAMHDLPYEEIRIKTRDRLMLYGRLYDPGLTRDAEGAVSAPAENTDEYVGPTYPLVILLHGLGRTHTAWSDLPATLTRAGYAVFAMDLRGMGKSTQLPGKHRVSWRFMKAEDWQKLPGDVHDVIAWFKKKDEYPEVDAGHLALLGEKLGANVAVFVAKDHQPATQALVLISPGLDYKGLVPSQAIVDYAGPSLLMTTQGDDYSYMSTHKLFNWLPGAKQIHIYDQKVGVGADLLNTPAVGEQIRDWLLKQMPPPASAKPAAEKEPVKG